MGKPFLDRIKREALSGDVVKALRLCLTLGNSSSSAELREWASLELGGYGPEDDLPNYRRIVAPLCIDGQTLTTKFIGQEISGFDLPDFARDTMTSKVNLPYSIPQLRDMAQSAERKDEPIKLTHPGAADLVSYMNRSGDYQVIIQRLYWQVPSVLVNGLVERVRTDILRLVSEMRSGRDSGQKAPSPELGSQAFNVVQRGDANSTAVKDTQNSGPNPSDKSPARRRIELIAWIATIISTVVGLLWRIFG